MQGTSQCTGFIDKHYSHRIIIFIPLVPADRLSTDYIPLLIQAFCKHKSSGWIIKGVFGRLIICRHHFAYIGTERIDVGHSCLISNPDYNSPTGAFRGGSQPGPVAEIVSTFRIERAMICHYRTS